MSLIRRDVAVMSEVQLQKLGRMHGPECTPARMDDEERWNEMETEAARMVVDRLRADCGRTGEDGMWNVAEARQAVSDEGKEPWSGSDVSQLGISDMSVLPSSESSTHTQEQPDSVASVAPTDESSSLLEDEARVEGTARLEEETCAADLVLLTVVAVLAVFLASSLQEAEASQSPGLPSAERSATMSAWFQRQAHATHRRLRRKILSLHNGLTERMIARRYWALSSPLPWICAACMCAIVVYFIYRPLWRPPAAEAPTPILGLHPLWEMALLALENQERC
ncbi:hypothetical protein NUW54_g3365 [Trametes sanguinea]|uniref:Uncharacterized protein n=1 Tax=Trametes sanguinea TaxID=158606 RepID=A0ACC1Q2M5_9APHY|nr:hypothetical protein NUW54_g3365 [Trametes sanguinea]